MHGSFLYSFRQQHISPWSIGVFKLCGKDPLLCVYKVTGREVQVEGGVTPDGNGAQQCCTVSRPPDSQCKEPQSHMLITSQGQGCGATHTQMPAQT